MLKLRKFLSCALALLLAVSMPLAALAEEYDLAEGSVTVNATESGQTVTHGTNDAVEDNAPVITQSTETTTNTITINSDAGATANVTLDGVNIDVGDTGDASNFTPGEAAIQTSGDGNVIIELDGENTVQSGYMHAGVEKNNGGNLTITNTDEITESDPGSLKATGGHASAGIGGGLREDGSNITITGNAQVEAQGGMFGAGIGGGYWAGGNNITIEGNAQVKAHNPDSAAGIGGGLNGEGSNITITDNAQVEAQGGLVGAGIGGGWVKEGTNITISGNAQVKVQGGKEDTTTDDSAGAAIGGGGNRYNPSKEAEVTTDAPAPTDSYGLYAGALDEGWIAKYEPTADMGKDIPTSLIYGDGEGTVTISKENDTITFAGAVDPTCTEAGNQAGFSVNGSLVAVSIPATGHSFTTYVSNNNPTCTTNCTETANCDHSDCTATDTRDIADTAWGHKFTNYIYDDNATCTEDGSKTAQCDHGCGLTDTVTDTGSALGHSFTNYISDGNATYDQDGTKTAKCERCDENQTLPDPGSKLVKPVAVVEFDGIDETAFWKNVVEQIQSANPGDTIEVNAGGICTIPYWVIDAAVEHGVALSIHWRCGEDIVIDRQPDQQLWVYSFTTLPQMLGK